MSSRALADLARDVVAACGDGGALRIVGHHRLERQDDDEEPRSRASCEDEGETVAPHASFNNEVGAPLTMLRVTARHAVPGQRVRCERSGRDRPTGRPRRARHRRRADGRHGARRRLRRHRGHRSRPSPNSSRRSAPGGIAVLNADDPRVAAMAPIARGARASRCAGSDAGAHADVRADDVEVTADGHAAAS